MAEENEEKAGESVFTPPNIIKAVVWLIPVIFGAGAIYASVDSTQKKAAENAKAITEIRTSHVAGDKSRAVQRTQIKGLKTNQQNILKEVKEIRTEQRVMQQNMAAVCQATNANCSR